MKFTRLQIKISMAIFVTCLITALFFTMVIYPYEIKRRQTRIEEIKVLLSSVYGQKREELANEVFAGHKEALADTLIQMQKVRGIRGIIIFDLNGKPLMFTGNPFIHKYLSDDEMEKMNESFFFNKISIGNAMFFVYSTPIRVIGEHVGFLKIYFDLSLLEEESNRTIIFFIILFLSTVISMAMALNILLARLVTLPLSKLRDAMFKVQNGKLGHLVKLDSDDEIGEMGAAFNRMSTRLKQQQSDLILSMEARDRYFAQLEKSNKALEELNKSLEQMVDERTNALLKINEELHNEIDERRKADNEKKRLEERLARSQKMEALGLLAGGVAHDLNNVLSGIVSYPDLLLMDIDDNSPLKKPIEVIRDSGQKAAAIVQDLLTLARRGVTNTQTLNLNENIIQDYLNSPEFAKLLSYHPAVKIEIDLDRNLLNIKGSAIHLRKTLMNLVSNAAEAQPDGGKILIKTENIYVDKPIYGYESIKEGDYVLLMVSDKGMGISHKDLNRIFEPFYTKKAMGRSGTGLGMAVVWGTVQDHNGYINVHSKKGKGTVFELYFPVTREKICEKCPDDSRDINDISGNGELVLVVDDIKDQRKIACSILKRLGYESHAVSSGEQAIEYIKKRTVDIIILDMIMEGGIDGLDTYRKIISVRSGQKAIIASGFAENKRVKEALKLGAGCYIKKPYTLEIIGRAIKAELCKK